MHSISNCLLIALFSCVLLACEGNLFSNQEKALESCCEISALEGTVGSGKFYIPNIFTPDSNNNNDRFFVHADLNIEIIESLEIFNERNKLVFEAKNMGPNLPNDAWDGSVDGEKVAGVFSYTVTIRSVDGAVETFNGSICSLPCLSEEESSLTLPFFDNCYTYSQRNGYGRIDPSLPTGES